MFARFCLISSGKNSEWIENRDQWPLIKGLAVATVTLACLLHGTWRRGGIWVNNSFAVLKLGTLLVMIIAGFVYMGGSLGPKKGEPTDNFSTKNSFSAPNLGFSVYSQSLSWIMFSYAGYENGNYVRTFLSKNF